MDGVMFSHHDRMKGVSACLADKNTFGVPRTVTSAFTFAGDAAFYGGNIRTSKDTEPLGCLGDLGWYVYMFAL